MYHARYEKPLKNQSLFVAKKVWKRILHLNAVALSLEENTLPKIDRERKKRSFTVEDLLT